jgi:hypothetical protein
MKSHATAKTVATCATVAALAAWAPQASARPGTHGPSVATWDARASSVMLSVRPGFLSGGHFFMASYNANFSNTTGNLSAQFGFHYLNFGVEQQPTAHGVSGTAVAVISAPVMERYDNGVPKLAVGFFLGTAPSVLISGELNYLSIPAVVGIGLPYSPHKMVTLTPWFELSPGLSLDAQVHPIALAQADPLSYCTSYPTPANPNAPLVCPGLNEQVARDAVNNTISLDTSFTVGARAGLDVGFHLTDSFGIDLGLTAGSLGTAFKGTTVIWAGGSLVWYWDDIVPAVLPPEKRLFKESCEDIERRFYTCPQSEKCPLARPPTQSTAPAPGQAPEPQPGALPPASGPAPMSPAQPPPATPQPMPAPAPTTTPYIPPPPPAPPGSPYAPQPQPYVPLQPQPAPAPAPAPAPIPAPAPPPAYPMTPAP